MKPIAKITVAIPTLDRPDGLLRCLEALLIQGTVLPKEVLVIDQGNHQMGEKAINGVCSNSDVAIVHCSQARLGLSAARNLASSQATQEIIAFTDDDCVPDPDWLASIERTFASNSKLDGVTGRILPFGDASPELFPISTRTSKKGAMFQGRKFPWDVGSGGNFAIKREKLQQVNGYDERLGTGSAGKSAEDIDIFYRLLLAGTIIRYQPETVIYHERQDAERLIRSFWNYSHGFGAFTAKHLRKGDLYVAYLWSVWFFWLVWRTLKAVVLRQKVYACEGLLSLKGFSYGMAYGFKLR
jgi:GT2 family glycosyltransferase